MQLRQVRRGFVTPRNGVHVEAVTRIAGSLHRRVDTQLDRRQLGIGAYDAGRNLVGRGRELDLYTGTRAVIGMHTR